MRTAPAEAAAVSSCATGQVPGSVAGRGCERVDSSEPSFAGGGDEVFALLAWLSL